MSRRAPEFFCKNKARLYPLFLLTPATPLAAFFIWQKFGEPDFWAYLTPFVVFVCVPLLDWLIGRDQSNPEPEVISRLEHDFWLNSWPPLAALIVIGSVFWGGYVYRIYACQLDPATVHRRTVTRYLTNLTNWRFLKESL